MKALSLICAFISSQYSPIRRIILNASATKIYNGYDTNESEKNTHYINELQDEAVKSYSLLACMHILYIYIFDDDKTIEILDKR